MDTKVNSEWIKAFIERPENFKLSKEKHGGNYTVMFWMMTFSCDHRSVGDNSKSREMGFYQTEKLMHTNANHEQCAETSYALEGDLHEPCA